MVATLEVLGKPPRHVSKNVAEASPMRKMETHGNKWPAGCGQPDVTEFGSIRGVNPGPPLDRQRKGIAALFEWNTNGRIESEYGSQ